MRKALLVSLIVFVCVVAGSISITWFLQAAEVKRNIERAIASLNTEHSKLEYDAIETSGFPRDVIVAIVNPRFAGRVDLLLQSLDAERFSGLPQWQENAALDGRITFSVNAFSSHYGMAISGDWRSNGAIGGQPAALASRAQGDLVCNLRLGRGEGLFGTLWNFRLFARDEAELWRDFRLIDCAHPGYMLADATSGETLMSSGPQRIYLQHEPTPATESFRAYWKSADAEVTPAGDKAIALYMNALAPDGAPPQLSIYGRQNGEMDVSFSGPAGLVGAEADGIPLDIHIARFDLSNQVYATANRFRLNSVVSKGVRTATLALQSDSTFSERYDAVVAELLRNYVAQLYARRHPEFPPLQQAMEKYPPDEFYRLVQPAIPHFYSLGKITLAADARYLGSEDFSSGEMTLDALKLAASPYGIEAKGSVRREPQQMLPISDMTFVCTHCLRLVDDLAAYADRVRKVLALFAPQQQEVEPLDPRLVQGIKQFLSAIAQPAPGDSATFTFHVISDGKGDMTVNGKGLEEIMALYNRQIAPFVQPPVPTQSQQMTPQPGVTRHEMPEAAPPTVAAPTGGEPKIIRHQMR